MDNEISYLLANIHSRKPGWMIKANLEQARCVLAISLTPGVEKSIQMEEDKQIAYAVSRIVDFFPNLQINMIMQTKFGDSLSNHKDFLKVSMIQSRKMNESIIANSVENHGLSTMISNLLSM
jgi:hypothetical protein